jgi:hypothetical protein
MSSSKFSLKIVAVLLVGMVAASAQVLRGTVTNGTTKKPVGGTEVVLIRLDKGMQEEARTKANARGEFSFELADNQVMRAVRSRYQNVNYIQPVLPGSSSVVVTVYESAPVLKGVERTSHLVVFRAQGSMLEGFEVFNVTNNSNPPRTQPAFDFYLPAGATIESADATREGAMTLKVGPAPQNDNKYIIPYPLFPGRTHFEVVYKLPYSGSFKYQPRFAGPEEKYYVFTPKSMGFTPDTASGYQTADAATVAGDLKGMDVHTATTGDENKLAFQIQGEGLIPEAPQQQSADANARQPGEPSGPGGGLGVPNERPNPLTNVQPWFLGLITLFMAGGGAFVFLMSRSQPVAVAKPHATAAPLLDALKEEMFQLEADRLHGKIAGREYEAAKSVLDKTLQRAMKNRVIRRSGDPVIEEPLTTDRHKL